MPEAGDALEQWLAEPLVMTNADPITYWSGMLAVNHPLAQMALDYLSIPGEFVIYNTLSMIMTDTTLFVATSTDVERAFSRGGLTVSKLRHSLSDKSVRSATVLGAWCEKKGLVPISDITEVFRNKKRRTKKKQVDSDVITVED